MGSVPFCPALKLLLFTIEWLTQILHEEFIGEGCEFIDEIHNINQIAWKELLEWPDLEVFVTRFCSFVARFSGFVGRFGSFVTICCCTSIT